ncbi:MAG: 30S ribosomal protein S6 [Armatimonadetes bacterium]|nr:30S ribosomal protein S6 [Armatimonadota bacterium]
MTIETAQRPYEAFYILPAGLDGQAVESILEKHRKFIEEQGGTVEKAELWEKRYLAFPINGHSEGNYCLIHFTAAPGLPRELGRLFRLSDEVIRARIFSREG